VTLDSQNRLSEVYPPLAYKIRELANTLAAENIEIRVTQGLRSWDVQNALYQQGRTTPGHVVTHAPPGHSWHNFGLAVDVAPFQAGLPDWNVSHPEWPRLVSIAEGLGLVSGSMWTPLPECDWPHLQYVGRFPTTPDDEAREILAGGGVQAVWTAAFS
jgi:peptidoglycan L-alanyl-D-glutamate endopeptidase CwlK